MPSGASAYEPVATRPPDAGQGSDQAVAVLGVPFTLCSRDEGIGRVRDMIENGRPHHVVLANAHTLNLASERPGLPSRARATPISSCATASASRWPRDSRARTHGTTSSARTSCPRCCESLAPTRCPGVSLRRGARCRRARGARPRGAGAGTRTSSGWRPATGTSRASSQHVRAARPDVFLVALGNPLQERWIDEHLEQLGVPVSIGVGALFDYLAGRVPRAPRWVLRARIEWLFRLVVEPRRLWRRYVMGNPRFMWRVLRSRGREQW